MIELTDLELEEVEDIKAVTRYDAMEQLASILGASLTDKMRWNNTSRCLVLDGCRIEISTRKNKVENYIQIVRIDVFGPNKEWKTYKL